MVLVHMMHGPRSPREDSGYKTLEAQEPGLSTKEKLKKFLTSIQLE
jgi:hypothetical protein